MFFHLQTVSVQSCPDTLRGEMDKRSECSQDSSKTLDELVVCMGQGGANTCVLWYVHPKWMEMLLFL